MTLIPIEKDLWLPSIFVSYSKQDRDNVVQLLLVLDELHIPYFDYEKSPIATDDLRGDLRRLVGSYDAIITILGRNCFDSEFFSEEFNTAGIYNMPQCIIQYDDFHGRQLLLLTQQFVLVDARADSSKALSGLKSWFGLAT